MMSDAEIRHALRVAEARASRRKVRGQREEVMYHNGTHLIHTGAPQPVIGRGVVIGVGVRTHPSVYDPQEGAWHCQVGGKIFSL